MVKGRDDDVELPQLWRLRPRPDLETVVSRAAKHFAEDAPGWGEGRRCDGLRESLRR